MELHHKLKIYVYQYYYGTMEKSMNGIMATKYFRKY